MKKLWFCILGVTLINLSCSFSFNPRFAIGTVSASQLSISTEIDENGQAVDPSRVFSTDVSRVYATFLLDSTNQVPISLLWYRDGELIFDQHSEHNSGWVFSWLEAPDGFPPGAYKVEIRSQTILLTEIDFTVEEVEESA